MTPNILIVDDDEAICEGLTRIFEENLGFKVDVAYTGEAAIRKSHSRHYSMALVDIILPDMDGVALLLRLKETIPKMVKIIITGNATLDNAIAAVNNGADFYIMKPIKPEELLLIVKDKLEDQAKDLKMTQGRISEFIKKRLDAL